VGGWLFSMVRGRFCLLFQSLSIFFLISFHFAHTDGVSDGTSLFDAT
jgi:hypothetical protein